jgi:CBS domain-containing protein
MLRIRDIMTTDVTGVSPETTIREAMEVLARAKVSGAPVLSGNKVVGVVTTSDLLAFAATIQGAPTQRDDDAEWREWSDDQADQAVEAADEAASAFFSELWDDAGADVSERMFVTDQPEWNTLEDHTVSEVMTRLLCTLPSTADAREAAEMMRERGIHRVLVVDNGELVGIVSALDIAKAAADKRFTTRTYVFEKR